MFAKINKWLKNDQSGFTLIELMVVVVILGILAAVVIPQFSKSTDKARVSSAKAELKNMQSAMEIYYAENGDYPTNAWAALKDVGIGDGSAITDPWGGNYANVTDADGDLYFYTYDNGNNIIQSNDL